MRTPTLHDDLILLDAITLADAAAHLAGEDDEIVRWLGQGERSTPETVGAWIERNLRSWELGGPVFAFAVRERTTGTLVGHVDANVGLDQDGVGPGEANVSYSLHARARGRGYATRAVELVCSFLRDREAAAAVIRAEPDNPASLAVAERAGFVRGDTITTRDGHTLVVFRRTLAAAP